MWPNCFLSMGDKVVLLNSILSNFSIFIFPFYKAPGSVKLAVLSGPYASSKTSLG